MKRLALTAILLVGALSGGGAVMLTVALATNPVAIGAALWIWLIAVGVAAGAVYASVQRLRLPARRIWLLWVLAFGVGMVVWIMVLRQTF